MSCKKVEVGCGSALSSLPDDILAQILCLLPTKLAASTPILSKRWRNLFSMMIALDSSDHHLQFDDSYYLYPNKQRSASLVRESFGAFVDSTLSLHQQGNPNKPIRTFSLKCQDDCQHLKDHTSRWISNALERGVSDVDLRSTMPLLSEDDLLERLLPCSLFTSKTLVKLTLGSELCLGACPLPVFSLPLLKTLSLHTVWFSDQDVSDRMLEGCPVLEELYVYHKYIKLHRWSGSSGFSHKTIKRITIHLDYHRVTPPNPRRVTFNTPNLTYLDYSDNVDSCDYLYADFLDSLLEARIDLALSRRFYCDTEYYAPFITWICNAQILSLSSATVELMCQCFDYWSSNGGFPFFKNLTKLSLQCKNKKGWKLLWNMIKSSPNLETLILKGFQSIRNGGAKVDGSVVKVVEIYGYRGTRREFNQVKRFFQEIESLEVMKVQIDAKLADDKQKLQNDNQRPSFSSPVFLQMPNLCLVISIMELVRLKINMNLLFVAISSLN